MYKNRLQVVADHINDELSPKFLACPGFHDITIIRNDPKHFAEYKLSYMEDNNLAFSCDYEVFNGKVESKMHMAHDLDLKPLLDIARKYADA